MLQPKCSSPGSMALGTYGNYLISQHFRYFERSSLLSKRASATNELEKGFRTIADVPLPPSADSPWLVTSPWLIHTLQPVAICGPLGTIGRQFLRLVNGMVFIATNLAKLRLSLPLRAIIESELFLQSSTCSPIFSVRPSRRINSAGFGAMVSARIASIAFVVIPEQ